METLALAQKTPFINNTERTTRPPHQCQYCKDTKFITICGGGFVFAVPCDNCNASTVSYYPATKFGKHITRLFQKLLPPLPWMITGKDV